MKSGTLEVSWQLWEYPEGTENDSATQASAGIEILQNFDFYLEHETEFKEAE